MKKHVAKVANIVVILSVLLFGSLLHQGNASAAISKQFWTNNLILLPSTDYDRLEADRMVDRLLAIPQDVLETLVYQDVEIRLVNGPITDEPEYAYLRGVVPRGWEGTGRSWDDIPGAGGNPTVIRIGYSEPGQWHGSYNLELHETLHAVDRYVFDNISESQAFLTLFNAEAWLLFPNSNYQDSFPEEYFAEVASMYLLGGTTEEILKTGAPKTYAYIQKLFAEYKATPNQIAELKRHWAKQDLERLASLGIINGFGDGTIRPDEQVTRAQFIKMLIESIGTPLKQQGSTMFTDVSDRSWAAPYIRAAAAEGIILPEEYANNRFEPSQALTRAEMAVWMARALKLVPDESALTFADSTAIAQDQRGLIGATVQSGLISGMPQNTFQPKGVVNRAQAATILNRMLNM